MKINDKLTKDIRDIISNITGKILWTNPSPTDVFEAQNITLNSDDYDYIEVFYYSWTNNMVESCKVPKGYNINLSTTIFSTSLHYGNRTMTRISDTEFAVSDAKGIASSNPSTIINDNDWIIPFLIIGYKH